VSAVRTPRKDALLEELAREEAGLADLDRQREAARTRVETLRAELSAISTTKPTSPLLPLATSLDSHVRGLS